MTRRRSRLNPRATTLDVVDRALLAERRPALRGVPLCTGFRAAAMTTGLATTQTAPYTMMMGGVAGFEASDLRVVMGNWRNNQYNEGVAPFADIFSAEYDMAVRVGLVISGVTYELTFGGQRLLTLSPGGWRESDPLPAVDVVAGQLIKVVVWTNAANWKTQHGFSAQGGNAGVAATTDYTADGSAQVADGGGSGIGPFAVTATPKNKRQRTVAIVGASDAEGVSDGYQGNGFQMAVAEPRYGSWGFIIRALRGKTGAIQTARTGDTVSRYILPVGHKRRGVFLSSCSDLITTYGLNDVINGVDSLATIQANKITEWLMHARRGCRVWQTTWTPITTSTDNWKTLGNQTVTANEAKRTGFNDWVRDGAPINIPALTPAAVGVAAGTGIARIGSAAHPVYGYFDVADAAESARNSGKWRVSQIVTRTDGAITSGSNVLTTAGKVYTNADLWSLIEVAGAGAAGGVLRAFIGSVAGSTCTLVSGSSYAAINAGTTVAGATVVYKLPTVDGLHGTNDLHEQMQTAIDTTKLLSD